MTKNDSSRARLVELALALSGVSDLQNVLDISVLCLERSYPGTRWAILDELAPGRYRATSRAISRDGLRCLLEANASKATLSVEELREDANGDAIGPADCFSQISEPDSRRSELIVGAWKTAKFTQADSLAVNDICRLIHGAVKARRELERLRNQSMVDELTGLPNRRGILKSLSNEETRLKRYGGLLSVLFVDLNYFKEINDRYGHKAGDRALRTCARTMREVLRASDYVGRFGGDEFLGVLPGVDLRAAHKVAARMKRAMEQTNFVCGNDTIFLGASVGVASVSEGVSGNKLIERADERMYSSKRRAQKAQKRERVEPKRTVSYQMSQMV